MSERNDNKITTFVYFYYITTFFLFFVILFSTATPKQHKQKYLIDCVCFVYLFIMHFVSVNSGEKTLFPKE